MKPYRRTRVLLPGTFQIRLLGKFVGIAITTLLVQLLFVAQQLSDLASRMPAGGEHLFAEIPSFLVFGLAVSLIVLLPAVGLIAVNATFRVAGPVYRFERYLESVVRGEADHPCRIRKKDELQYLCTLINDALEVARAGKTKHEDLAPAVELSSAIEVEKPQPALPTPIPDKSPSRHHVT